MSEQIGSEQERDQEDVTVVFRPCGCVTIMCVTKYIDAEARGEIADAVADDGCSVKHMSAAEARKQKFMCDCAKKVAA